MSEATPQPALNAVHWFEIATYDLDRATTFYEAMLACTKMHRADFGYPMAIFPYVQPGIGGALVQAPHLEPSRDGVFLYLNCEGKLDGCIERVEPAGGKLLKPRTDIAGGFGSFALIEDTEGNRIALHTGK